MKRFIVIISALFCMSFAQDIAGSWTLTAVDVMYNNFARPNPLTADPANGANQYATPLYMNDTYNLGVSQVLAWLPPGAMFLSVPNGPFGEAGLAANGVNLNVTLYDNGTGIIPEGSTYPDIELDESICTTYGQVLPVTDAVIYESDKDAGNVLPTHNIVGQPSLNPYAGQAMGMMSLQNSVVFSYFPTVPQHDWSPIPLYFSASEGDAGAYQVAADTWIIPGTSLTPNENGVFTTAGVTGGWIKTEDFVGSIGDNDPYDFDAPGCESTEPPSCFQVGEAFVNPSPDLALYWHTIDGYSADTGFGDDGLDSDEDGDGTDFDRIFGLPALSSTRLDAGFAASVGFTGVEYMVAGDITGPLSDMIFDGCIAQVAPVVAGQCGEVLAGGVAQCMYTFDEEGNVTGTTGYTEEQCLGVINSLPGGAGGAFVSYFAAFQLTQIAAAEGYTVEEYSYGGCLQAAASEGCGGNEACGAGGFAQQLCLGFNFSESACGFDADDPATDENEQGLANMVMNSGITSCAELSANWQSLTDAAAGLVDTADGDDEGDDNCAEWALEVADGFAALDAATGNMSCTDLAAASIAAYTEVTTTDDYPGELEKVNKFYVMNPDPAAAQWSNFVTFNAVMYSLTGNPAFLTNDSGHDLDPLSIIGIDAFGVPCTLGTEGCNPYSGTGGRLVMEYEPTCVPVIESVEVQTEFLGFEEGECTHDGDVTGDNATNVLDVVAIVQSVIGNSTLTDDQLCRADINEDTLVNVLDVVAIVNSIVNGRDGAPASSVEFIRTSQGLEMNADGVVDAVQLTLSHGDDFSIDLTDNAFVAEYSTKDNQTTLMVVAPEGNEIFTASGEYTIDEMIAANKDGYVPTSQPVSFNLSEAYPNPFNPSTSLEISLNVASNVSITAYNVMGQVVSVIHDGNIDAGTHAITWNASNLASGMYVIKAEAAGNVINQKVMLIK